MAKTLLGTVNSDQNPAPYPATEGQGYQDAKAQLTAEIMTTFRKVLPSNWVARTNGPWYSLQFQGMAEQLAEIQLNTAEVLKDSTWDFTRPDFLWQVLGSFVFPGATDTSGIPQIDGDVAYRTFLQKMVGFLLLGATKGSLVGGLEALSEDAIVTLTERYLETAPRNPNGGYTIKDQFTIDILMGSSTGGFIGDPFITQRNAELVLAALKPAHVLYTYANLFQDAFEKVADDTGGLSFDLDSYHYDDLRKWCLGAAAIASTYGETLTNKLLFSDPHVSFESVQIGATLSILDGPNFGRYGVKGRLYLPYGVYPTPVAYNTSVGASGTLIAISADTVQDASQNWGGMPVDTTLEILSGPNKGVYRLDTVLGSNGGPIGTAGISGDKVRLSPSILKLDRKMPQSLTNQSYTVVVDRLGVQVPKVIEGEDVSQQFYL